MRRIAVLLTGLLLSPSLLAQTETKLTASDAAAGDNFGNAVAVSGATAVIGARGNRWAYVFDRSGMNAGRWGQSDRITGSDTILSDQFGRAVAVSGAIAVVGSPFDSDGGSGSGSAYVFARSAPGSSQWVEVAKLTASDAAQSDQFGWSVAVSGDTVVVGSWFDDDGGLTSGSAYVFERDAGGPDGWGEVAKLTALDAAQSDRFGVSVSVSGDTAIVGAYFDDDAGDRSGSAYVFDRDAGGLDSWGQVAKLVAADAAVADQFGFAVSVSGDIALISAYAADAAATDSGAAYVFARDAGGLERWGEVAKLTASDAAGGDLFGQSVSVSGDTAVIGANGDDDAGSASGAAYVFTRSASTGEWEEVAKLTAGDAAPNDQFGIAVAASGDTALVGANGDDDAGSSSGAAYAFRYDEVFVSGFEF